MFIKRKLPILGLLFVSMILTGGTGCVRTGQNSGSKTTLTPPTSPTASPQTPSSPLLPVPSSNQTLEDGGAIQGGGGGDFSVSTFWYKVGEVRRELVPENMKNLGHELKPEQMVKLIALMDPKVTLVKISNEELYVTARDGKRQRVDAVNIPETKTIILFKPSWEKYDSTGTEVRHLILHEFLGLAGIDDEGHKVSNQFFTPGRQNISPDLKTAYCGAFGQVHLVAKTIRTYPAHSSSDPIEFNGPARVGEKREKCSPKLVNNQDGASDASAVIQERCETLDHTFDLKTARSVIILDLAETLQGEGIQSAHQEIQIRVDIALSSGERIYGWGALAGKVDFQAPVITATARLILIDKKTKKVKILDLANEIADFADSHKNVSLEFVLYNSDLYSQLEKYGVDLRLSQPVTNTEFLSAENFWKSLLDFNKKQAPQEKEEDAYLKKTIFRDLGIIVPHYFKVYCRLW